MIKKLLNKIEVNKFNKLLNNENTIPIVSGDTLIAIYDRNKKISYAPSLNLSIR